MCSPSFSPCFPSALLHLFIVEMRALFTVLLAWYALSNEFAFMMVECVGVTPEETDRYQGCEHNGTVMFKMSLIPAVALIFYTLISFFWEGAPRSFGSGAYLLFAWSLERRRCYKVLVGFVAFMPVLNFMIIISEFLENGLLDKKWVIHNKRGEEETWKGSVMKDVFVPTALLLAALYSLVCPEIPTHTWDADQFKNVVLARSWANFFCQTNDAFGFKLVDALWTAENGRTEVLMPFLKSPGDLAAVQQACREAKSA